MGQVTLSASMQTRTAVMKPSPGIRAGVSPCRDRMDVGVSNCSVPSSTRETLFFSLSSHCTIDAPGLRDLVSVLRPGTEKSLRNAKERCFSLKRFVEGGNVSNWDEQFGNQIKAKMDEKWMPQSPWESSRTMHSLLPLSQGRKPCSLKSRSYYFEILQAPQHSAVLFLFFVVLCMVFFRCNKQHFYFWMMFPARYWLEMPWPESLACG